MVEPSAENLKVLAVMRLADAKALLDAGRHSGAYYLAGYAVECAVKAIIAPAFCASVIPDRRLVESVYTHSVTRLVAVAGLEPEFRAKARSSDESRLNWALVAAWSEASRYDVIDPFRATDLVRAIEDGEQGVLSWLKTHW